MEKIAKKLGLKLNESFFINGINDKKFPGFYRNLRELTIKMLPRIKSSIKTNNDILLYINLYMEDFDEFQKKPSLRSFNLSEKDWKGVLKVKKFLLKSLSPSASIISCDVLCNILKKYFPEEKSSSTQKKGNPNPNMKPNPNMNPHPHMNTINHMEINARNKKKKEKTDLDKISEKLIEKLKDTKLNPEDLDDLEDPAEKLNPKENKSRKEKDRGQKKSKNKKKGNGEIDKESDKNNQSKDVKESDKKFKNSSQDDELDDLIKNKINLDDLKKDLKPRKEGHTPINNERKKDNFLAEIRNLVKNADDAMKERLLILGGGKYFISSSKCERERKVINVKIESQKMCPDTMTYVQLT